VFSHPVIRGLGIAVVDEDRSETSRAFVEQVAASPVSPSFHAPATSQRPRGRYDRGMRSRPSTITPQISSTTSKQTDARRSSPSITNSTSPQRRRVFRPERQPFCRREPFGCPRCAKALAHRLARRGNDRIGEPAAELRPVPAARPAADGDPRGHRQSPPATQWARNSGGAARAPGSRAPVAIRSSRWPASWRPLFVISSSSCWRCPLFLEGLLGVVFKGDVPMIIVAGSLLIVGYPGAGGAASAAGMATSRPDSASPASSSRQHSGMRRRVSGPSG